MPTVMCYVADTPRCSNPSTFMSNMLYACSILYKTKLPLVMVFNKIDHTRHEFATEWMTDFQSFQSALQKETSYMSTLTRSMSLVFDEFYEHLRTVGVSSMTGEGMEELFTAIDAAAEEYYSDYKPYLDRRLQEQAEARTREREEDAARLRKDLDADRQSG
eukprot:TRINITY_DN12257_c0_g1_i1.p1 TRINITY_DN12257_c0_g1~~TRINITY_DN12257_c0_g1_i1.p1  ORF type:complete len:161 (+),score=36.11 TRINITY_DN12257_c0_g1_i1:173-655(+)